MGALVAQAGTKELALWSDNPRSVQALIYTILEAVADLDIHSKDPQNSITRKQLGFAIETDEGSINCESFQQEKKEHKSYRCLIENDISEWTNDAGSVQAVLYDSFETFLNLDKESAIPRKIVAGNGVGLEVKDKMTSISCHSDNRGLEQVQYYSCQIK